jgi:hypothetical protein
MRAKLLDALHVGSDPRLLVDERLVRLSEHGIDLDGIEGIA